MHSLSVMLLNSSVHLFILVHWCLWFGCYTCYSAFASWSKDVTIKQRTAIMLRFHALVRDLLFQPYLYALHFATLIYSFFLSVLSIYHMHHIYSHTIRFRWSNTLLNWHKWLSTKMVKTLVKPLLMLPREMRLSSGLVGKSRAGFSLPFWGCCCSRCVYLVVCESFLYKAMLYCSHNHT